MADLKTSSNPPKTKIFVGRLPENALPGELRQLFSQYGNVTECDILNRYGFVHMETEEQAVRAIKALNNFTFMGSQISVEASTGKKGGRSGGMRSGGGGGFGGPIRGGPRGGSGPMRGAGGPNRTPYGRSEPYGRPDRMAEPYGRPEHYGRPDLYGRSEFDRRGGGLGGGPGPISGPGGPSQYGGPSGPVPGGPGLGGMPSMRNGYYDRIDDRLDRVDRLDRMERDTFDRVYDSYYGSQSGPIQPVGSSVPYDRPAMAATQSFDRRDYPADRMATSDMYRRRTPPTQTSYGGGYDRNGAALDPYGPPPQSRRYPDMPPRRY